MEEKITTPTPDHSAQYSDSKRPKSLMSIITAIVFVTLIAVGVFAYMSRQEKAVDTNDVAMEAISQHPDGDEAMMSDEKEGAAMMNGDEATSDAMMMEAKIVNVEAGSFYYKPNTITVKAGSTVKIAMNSVSAQHDFVIDELGVKMPIIKNGDTGTVEFKADKAGEYAFYCSVGNHRALGMEGTLVVEEAVEEAIEQ